MSELRFTTEAAIRQAHKHQKELAIVFWVLALISFGLAGLFIHLGWWLIFPIALALFGLILLAVNVSIRNDAIRFRKYAPLILDENITSVREIAIKTNNSLAQVTSSLKSFKDIDALKGIVFDWDDGATTTDIFDPQELVNCPNCGAAGQSGQCEYCNSII